MVVFNSFSQQEIDIVGNFNSIVDGDMTPSFSDDTDFGTFSISATSSITFTVKNLGTTNLLLTNAGPNYVSISGSSKFTISTQPTSGTIAPLSSLTFTVTFNASCPISSSSLIHNATITIPNNDANESNYTFAIRASVSGLDADGDGIFNTCDTDDDNDGVLDPQDPVDNNFNICGDSDGDGCDDCSNQVDGFGPLPDFNASNDGLDSDCDGICDSGDFTDNRTGERGTCLLLNGTSDFATIGNVPDLNFNYTDAFTIEAWVKTNSTQNAQILSKFSGGSINDPFVTAGWGFQFSSSANSLMFFMISAQGDGFVSYPTGLPTIADGLWHHVVVTYSGEGRATSCIFYVDGWRHLGFDGAGFPGPISGSTTNSDKVAIGSYDGSNGQGDFWQGEIDEVRVWSSLRTMDEVRINQHLSLTTGCMQNAIGNWKFNQSSMGATPDGSSLGNAALIQGATLIPSGASVGRGTGTLTKGVVTNNTVISGSGISPWPISLDVDFNAAPPNGDVVITVIHELPFGGAPAGSHPKYSQSHFIVDNYGTQNQFLNADLTYHYATGAVTDPIRTNYKLQKRGSRETGAWTTVADSASQVIVSNSLVFKGISSFSMFFPSATISPLPIELLDFQANCAERTVDLNWSTATENNNSHFDIEKSSDGKIFWKIGQELGAGNSSSKINYTFSDNINSEVAYYRLKQIDYDGNYTYSKIIQKKCFMKQEDVKVWPNPSNGLFNIELETKQSVKIELISITGSILMSMNNKDQKIVQVDLSGYTKGIYYLSIIDNVGEKRTKKIILN